MTREDFFISNERAMRCEVRPCDVWGRKTELKAEGMVTGMDPIRMTFDIRYDDRAQTAEGVPAERVRLLSKKYPTLQSIENAVLRKVIGEAEAECEKLRQRVIGLERKMQEYEDLSGRIGKIEEKLGMKPKKEQEAEPEKEEGAKPEAE